MSVAGAVIQTDNDVAHRSRTKPCGFSGMTAVRGVAPYHAAPNGKRNIGVRILPIYEPHKKNDRAKPGHEVVWEFMVIISK